MTTLEQEIHDSLQDVYLFFSIPLRIEDFSEQHIIQVIILCYLSILVVVVVIYYCLCI